MLEYLEEISNFVSRGLIPPVKSPVHENIINLTFLYDFLKTEGLEEIFLHSDDEITLLALGTKSHHKLPITNKELQLALEVLAIKNNQDWNYNSPFVSFYSLLYNSQVRVTLIHPSLSSKHIYKAFIRIIRPNTFKLKNYSSSLEQLAFLMSLTEQKKNIIISGATGCGKTSFLTALLNEEETNDHIVVIEDTHEIELQNKKTTYFLKNKNNQLTDFCAYSLRISPDRIIMGEIRSNEVIPFVLSMNHGHKGLISTIHADSAVDTLHRLALLFSLYNKNSNINYEVILQLITKNIDYVIYLKDKKISEIVHVLGSDKNQCFTEIAKLS